MMALLVMMLDDMKIAVTIVPLKLLQDNHIYVLMSTICKIGHSHTYIDTSHDISWKGQFSTQIPASLIYIKYFNISTSKNLWIYI